MKSPIRIGLAAAVMLVILRLSLGCHFLYEGVWKIKNPDFSAESFLVQAKGPAAPLFHAMVPDIDGRRRLEVERLVSAQALIDRWRKVRDGAESRLTDQYRKRLAAYEDKRAGQEGVLSPEDEQTVTNLLNKIDALTEGFRAAADPVVWEYEDRLEAFVTDNEKAILAWSRNPKEVPADEVQGWLSDINEIQVEFLQALRQSVGEDEAARDAVGRAAGAAKPIYDETIPLKEYIAGNRLRDSDKQEVLRVTRAISTEKFCQPWDELKQKTISKFGLDQQQQAEAERVYRGYKNTVRLVLADNQADIETYFEALDRFQQEAASGNRGAAHQQQRDYDRQQALRAEANVWLAGLEAADKGYRDALAGLLTPEQGRMGSLPVRWTQMDLIDFAVTYGLTAIGLCLLLGLFTRPAALGGGLFMLFVVLTQPAWPGLYPPDPPIVGHALGVNKDFVEMVALFTLAMTAAGRWGGLDFFVENFILRLFRPRKNKLVQT